MSTFRNCGFVFVRTIFWTEWSVSNVTSYTWWWGERDVRTPIDSEKDKICTEKKSMEHRERIKGCIDQLLFLGALITNRDPFVLTVIINLSCRTTKIIYSVKISLTYGILLHANVTTRVPRYKYRMYRAPAGRVIGSSLALFFKTNYSYIRVLHVHVLLSLLIQNQSDQ